jgi:hypothetical protein
MDLSKIKFFEEVPQNLSKQNFVFKDDVSLIVKQIIENNILLNQILELSYDAFKKDTDISKEYFNINLDLLYSIINKIDANTPIINIDYKGIKSFVESNTEEYIQSINTIFTADLRVSYAKEKHLKSF